MFLNNGSENHFLPEFHVCMRVLESIKRIPEEIKLRCWRNWDYVYATGCILKASKRFWEQKCTKSCFALKNLFCPCAPSVIAAFYWQDINRWGSERLLPKVSCCVPAAPGHWFKSRRHTACLLLWKSGLLMCVEGPVLYCRSVEIQSGCVNTSPKGALIRARVHSGAQ